MGYKQASRNYDNHSVSDRTNQHATSYEHEETGTPDRFSTGRYRDEVFSRRVPAGKRTYFFDVKTTRSGEDFFITITESKRHDDGSYEKHKIFLYKEDFGKFVSAMHEVVQYVREECLPGYDFHDLPELLPEDDYDDYDDGHDYDDGY
ncbi:MAG: DUF3276 family protein [Bacteroidetes bacterium]|nr:MAG: DUF3276 family protein [Bacteroidota bacterium]